MSKLPDTVTFKVTRDDWRTARRERKSAHKLGVYHSLSGNCPVARAFRRAIGSNDVTVYPSGRQSTTWEATVYSIYQTVDYVLDAAGAGVACAYDANGKFPGATAVTVTKKGEA